MHKAQEQVRDFCRACDLARSEDHPHFDFAELRGKALDLIKEEVKELVTALEEESALAVMQELCDVIYVCYGMAVDVGMDLEPFWEEIHKANMNKAHGPKRNDGKQLKPVDWQPPNLDKVLMTAYGINRVTLNNGGFIR